ncbi:CRM-domain containing factor CFM3, chloroplastic/mitochondrial-like [Impatiens glandulifera]|uniref:CRM-domain containing factor CFM3, chloroplastic/mitochondrial-like n=1 Tax=Impatiens glandulifera TaxID=253017 RepID=UPI001FB0FC3A|nr:CRM-domain containing factor CFM3, chloroplastic/mitochondrial-like [Impatiens glandulifera]XP_047337738.1 CRM-domain containing factor CFM3, chloroplastic/mitochondrial-like [Impatiens glandulifera]
MALATAKLTELPFRGTIPLVYHPSSSLRFRFFIYSYPKRAFSLFKPFSSLRSTTESTNTTNPTSGIQKPKVSSSAPWIKKWPSPNTPNDSDLRGADTNNNNRGGENRTESRFFDGRTGGVGTTAIERIALRLRNLGLGSDDDNKSEEEEDEEEHTEVKRKRNEPVNSEEKLGDLLRRDWVRPDRMLIQEEENESWLPWERTESNEEGGKNGTRKKTVKAPTLAELTIQDEELRRLRRQGIILRERVSVPKAGLTAAVLEKIHEQWTRSEIARLKFHEDLAHDMKTAHEIVERRTGGLVIWRSGSVMVVYRGSNYEGPTLIQREMEADNDNIFIPDVTAAKSPIENLENKTVVNPEKIKVSLPTRLANMTEEEMECNDLLNGLGPRFEDWWGTGMLPVDADLLPQTISGYKAPFRLLPTGMRSGLTNAEMTNLRKHAKSLPCHFALGRNRNHQGLAASIVKVWEKSLVVKIAVKRGVQNTNNKLMAEEIKELTGGVLLLRNKYYIVIYRGKDFLPTSVATALAERTEMTNQVQDVEEKVRSKAVEEKVQSKAVMPASGQVQAGTLTEFYENQAKWGRNITDEDREKMIEESVRAKSTKAVMKMENKQTLAQSKLLRAEKMLAKLEASMIPVGPSDDQETLTEEEKSMFRRVGLRMTPYLPLGIRGVFDGVIENMHLHWKHRELVKLISKQKNAAFIEETARLLEYESGGILVTIETIPKGHALIYYRGKNYRRPISLRPRNLLTKAKALRRSIAMQRYETLTQHMSELEKTIKQMKHEIGDYEDEVDGNTINFKHDEFANTLDSVESEDDESSWSNSDNDDENELEWDGSEISKNLDLDNDCGPSSLVG